MLRKLLKPAAKAFREAQTTIRNGDLLFNFARHFRRPYLTWKLGQHEEKEFWDSYFRTKGLDWPREYQERTSPDFQLQDYLVELLEGRVGYEVQILDVGSGPLTAVGTKWPQHFVNVVAVDPLADWYEYLFLKHNLRPHVKPIRGKAERIARLFTEHSFDLVHARNCIDHSINPLKALYAMVRVVKRDHYVFLNHAVNEAVNQEYHGPHQWNICEESGSLVLWGHGVKHNLSKLLNESCSEIRWNLDQDGWMRVRIRKRD